jgi:dTDP-4-amino-4,6-dideoxygalactose transaminase
MDLVPVFKPLIGEDELRAARRSLEIGWLGMGADVAAFEDALSARLGLHEKKVAAVST